ncbi:MAG: hypothetical protein COA33_002370 [Fluviicola sp.]|nr:hypothetical protein [Fluviicola sp.]
MIITHNEQPIILFFLLLTFSSLTQSRLDVEAYSNTTAKLEDNRRVDSIHVKIINLATNEESSFDFVEEGVEDCYLENGNFKLICSITGEDDSVIVNVRTFTGKITFVTLLFEPESELSRKQRKIRKKKYVNMREL